MNFTYERLKIVNALVNGPLTWTALRLAYYGEERAKSSASTSFVMQLQRMQTAKMIRKCEGGYELTEECFELMPGEHACARCNTSIDRSETYCVGCKEDRKAGGR